MARLRRRHGPRLATTGCSSSGWTSRRSAKNRVHLDLHPGEGERDAKVGQLLALGATKLWDGQVGPQTWVTLADPEGNELCVS